MNICMNISTGKKPQIVSVYMPLVVYFQLQIRTFIIGFLLHDANKDACNLLQYSVA